MKIQALSNGDVIKEESFFEKKKMPEFSKIENIFFIREDIVSNQYFLSIRGVDFLDIKIDGNFSKGYKLLTFNSIVDCIDEINSKRGEFDFFSTLVLDTSKVPENVDGFFLKNWNRYGEYIPIVNENLKNSLLQLKKATDFLIFDKL